MRLDDGGFDVIAVGKLGVVGSLAADKNFAAFLVGNVAVAEDSFLLRRGRQRSHLRFRVQRVAQPDGFGQRQEPVEELVRDALVQQQTRTGDTGLSLVMEDREGAAVDRGGQEGVVEDDVGALAAQLQLHALEVAGGSS